MKSIVPVILISLILAVIAFFVRDLLLSFAMTFIAGETMFFEESWKLQGQTFMMVCFVMLFGIIPYLYVLVKRIGNLDSIVKKVLSMSLVIGAGVLSLMIRLVYLKIEAAKLNDMLRRAEFSAGAEIPSIKLEELYLELFFGVGLAIGALLAILIFRRKRLTYR